ncbi:MAG: EVE domain-containing protein [Phycisphaerales bacterium]
MATFLIKTEPGDYSFSDLEREKRTAWSGVTNAAAQKHMRAIRKGDQCLFYHTGSEKRIVGLAEVVRGAYPDPDHPGRTASGEPKFVLFDIRPVARATSDQATLAAIRADERFAGFALVRQGRLSVMPVPEDLDVVLRAMAGLPSAGRR